MARKKATVHKKRKNHAKGWLANPRWVVTFVTGVVFILLAVFLNTMRPTPCANSLSCISDLSGTYDNTPTNGEFEGGSIAVPNEIAYTPDTHVLGATDAAAKVIAVDLTNQRLYAYENNVQVFSFPISSGKWGKTPTGEFSIWIKLRYTRMKGGNKELHTYYDLPNVPYTMFFYNDQIPKYRGFGIHGAYWHNNFGHPMSHGCINMAIPDVEKLYNWATPVSNGNTTLATAENPGTKIVIYGVAPNE